MFTYPAVSQSFDRSEWLLLLVGRLEVLASLAGPYLGRKLLLESEQLRKLATELAAVGSGGSIYLTAQVNPIAVTGN